MDANQTFFDRLNDFAYLELTLTQWLGLIALSLVLWTVLRLVLRKAIKRLQTVARHTASHWDDMFVAMMQRTHGLLIFILAFYASSFLVGAPPQTREIFYKGIVIGLFLQAGIWGNLLVEALLRRYLMKRNHLEMDENVDISAYSAINITGKFLLFTLLLLLLLDNLGVNITALVTGLGIGGIAIALAMQNILGDIFASLSIVLDRPFEVGDFIVVGDKSGTVENIGLKTSRIKSLSGEQLVFPNKVLIDTEISNFKRMQTRRIVFTIGVVYDTPRDKLQRIPEMIKEIIGSMNECKFDRAHFTKFAESSLDFEVVYTMQTPDYTIYMDTQQSINLALFERFAQENIDFAFPSRTVILQNTVAEQPKQERRIPSSVKLQPG
ncbi:MAG TPA: mechanosensitive ion channel family protein [Oligoflexus sp.]|uniref:mechanosensitive ion channel family protein n=1 Tax=Oligoflexus sp. TaxID=1971216 RepID=UPI002D487A11|nr:mechanosensitive ion channel family protein [Oligoflexus sp.]HYX32424.1 mechanosensitive ion channel family protein [Oligoflexus sp.]